MQLDILNNIKGKTSNSFFSCKSPAGRPALFRTLGIHKALFYTLHFVASFQVLAQDECYAADALLELGPAPPLPNKAELEAGGAFPPPGGAFPPPAAPTGAAAGAQQSYTPFNYPTPGAAGAGPFIPPYNYPQVPQPGAGGAAPYPPPQTTPSGSTQMSEKDLLSFEQDNGPPPAYFPPDLGGGGGASTQHTAAGRMQSVEDNNAAMNNLDIPELPEIPSDTPTHAANNLGDDDDEDDKKGNDDEEIDFDDLTKRFEALKKKK